jgi:riboflavin kinase/FMN adenylyltransferase
MQLVKTQSEERHARSVVITFDRNPEELVRPDSAAPYITTLCQKLDLIAEQGIDTTLLLPLEDHILDMPAERFISYLIHEKLCAIQLVVGPDFAFGHKRSGNVDLLRRLSEQFGYQVTTVSPVVESETCVSSTVIRALIAEGDVEKAGQLLGHPFVLHGRVVEGEHIGRTLGYPTANLMPVERQVVPANGVYAVTLDLQGRRWVGVASLGVRPTFKDRNAGIEVYIIGFSGNIYGQELEIAFHHRIRGETRFSDTSALIAQIGRDIVRAVALVG